MLCCLISLSLLSYHTNRDNNYNEVNPGIIVEAGHVIAGAYHNSHYRTTVFIGGRVAIAEFGPVKVDMVAALATGYRVPAVVGVRTKVGQHEFTLVPPTKHNSGVIAYSIRIN